MYSMRVECAKNNYCFGCLSSDRQLTLLTSHVSLFNSLLEYQQVSNPKIMLCWECKSILDKIKAFQIRVQRAQLLLQQSFCSRNVAFEKLSTLTITKKDFYDHIIEYDENKQKNIDKESNIFEIPAAYSIVIEVPNNQNINNDVNVKEELDDEDDLIKLDYDYQNTDDDYESSDDKKANYETNNGKKDDENDEDVDNKDEDADFELNEQRKESNNKNNYEAYLDKVIVSNADIDVDNLKKYCVSLTLNEKEIEELSEKEQNELRTGMRKDKPFECKDCKNTYRKELDLKRHITFNHLNRANSSKCKYCKKRCASWAVLEKHWIQYHNKYYKCTICGLTLPASTNVMYHISAAHAKKYTCVQCNSQFNSMKEFRKHYKDKHERLICDDCGKTFIKKRSLETHYKRHHLPPTCEVCNKTYAQYHNLDNHYRLNHPEFINCENRQELAYCVECNKQFPSVYKYRRHLTSAAVHTPPKVEIVPCPECGKVFSRKIRMTNHVMSVHRKNTKHRCDICNKTFCSAYSAKTHRQCVHEKVPMPKNKLCDICGRGFSTNRILANHRRTHTGERPYPCPHCPATFAQRVAMITHARTQHKNRLVDTNPANDSGIST